MLGNIAPSVVMLVAAALRIGFQLHLGQYNKTFVIILCLGVICWPVQTFWALLILLDIQTLLNAGH
jgi:hypothetical protein